ncbi:hypothetical protein FisN_4Lh138 [Fistulifera solaris]|uniref:EF-hand domain-containing protein n=1 Tax=Fistulifera solaris TaxID=1519565 RepID=A0A1Z5JZ36_FISSO|nr:hypothetical protein FisN_4Lh138 [Fistulifera solaris]|eukprot:GAX19285.1 hypothetical protein FisN_4Lh138 [Fistulifera solaris]
MLAARTDRTPTTGKKKRSFAWPFGHKIRKGIAKEARHKSHLARGPALLTNGTPPSSTASPHNGQNGVQTSMRSQNGNREFPDDLAHSSSQPKGNTAIHRFEKTDTDSLPSRFRRGLAPAKLHAMPHAHPPQPKTVSYKVPMKEGSESDRGVSRGVNGKQPTHPDAPLVTKASRARPRGTAWLRNSVYFRKICDGAFEGIDVDKSGSVDKKELYSGILLVHLNLGMYLGPAACKPLDRDKCNSIFEKMDVDRSGTLGKEEFRNVMIFLFGNVLLRVIVQWTATVTLVPIVAQHALNWLYYACGSLYETISTLDDRFILANWVEAALKATFQFILRCLPGPTLLVISEVNDFLQGLPHSVWNAAPLALLSSILGIVVVPWIIFQIDDFFQWLASRAIRRK